MALVVGARAADQPAYKAWLFRTRPLLIPAIALTIWMLYAARFLAIFRSSLWGNLRWAFLVLLAVQGLLEVFKWGGDTPLPYPIAGFALFSVATFASATYSIIPLLSLYKALSFLLALVGLVFGIGLRHRGRPDSWLRLLATANIVVASISLVTIVSPAAYDSGLLQGPFVNPNSLGSSLVLTLPGLLWLRELHQRQAPLLLRSKLLTAAVVLNVVLIFLSRSRTSLLACALVLVMFAALRASRFAWLIMYGMVLLFLISPTAASHVGREAVFKGKDLQGSVAIRLGQFDSTLEAAKSNPIAGYGFGTSAGDTKWDGSLSAAAVGREKSNAYLGTIEEVGLVGAIPLFLGLAGALALGLRAARHAGDPGKAAAAAALVAVVAAGLLHVNFEAWLTSSGSFEGFIFWSTMGVLLMNATNSIRG